MRKVFFILIFSAPAIALAAGGGHGSLMDLKWPFVNLMILAVFLIWKTKAPLASFFESNAKNIAEIYESAEERDKEAQIKLEMYQKKVKNLDQEYNKVIEDSRRDSEEFAKKHSKEMDEIINKIESDFKGKVEFEKKKILKNMESTLLENVISKTREKIEENSSLKDKSSRKLLSSIN